MGSKALLNIKNRTIGEELDRTDVIKQYRYNDANQCVGEIVFRDILGQKETFKNEVGLIDISILDKLK